MNANDTDTVTFLDAARVYAPYPFAGALFGYSLARFGVWPTFILAWAPVATLAVAVGAYKAAPRALRAFGRVAFRAARAAYRAAKVVA